MILEVGPDDDITDGEEEFVANLLQHSIPPTNHSPQIAQKKAALDADRAAAVSPSDIFKSDPKYSAWHPDSGLPTLTADGAEVTSRQQKKLSKKVKAHTKKHNRLLAKIKKSGASSNEEYFAQREDEIAKLENF